MSLLGRTLALLLATTLASAPLVACKRHDDTPPPAQGYGYGGYPPPGYYPPQQGGYYPPPQQPQPAPWAPQPAPASNTTLPPAFGFFCQSDNDLQCPYGRCVGGRCGGCSDPSQCKTGSSCIGSPVGMTCWPGGGGGHAPPPGPVPPQPTPTVPPPSPAPPPSGNDPFASARQSCVDRINAFRARVRVAPLARDLASEACVDEQSRSDARSNRAHGTFGRCGERAQNACPNYPGGTPEAVLATCLQQMFDEGPGGGHFDNMTNPKYTRAFCGFEQQAGDRFWAIQDFR
jgi:hypothetical protein